MADNNFDLKGFLNDPKVRANKDAAIKFLQTKGVIDAQGNLIQKSPTQQSQFDQTTSTPLMQQQPFKDVEALARQSQQGQINPASYVLQGANKLVQFPFDVAAQVIGEGAQKIGIPQAIQGIGKVFPNNIFSQLGKAQAPINEKVQQVWNDFATKHPEAVGNIQATGNLALLGMGGKIAPQAGEALDTASKVIGEGAQKLGTAGVAVAEKLGAPFAGSYDAETAKLFEEYGIKPPVSAITKSPFVKGAEAIAGKTAFGKTITNVVAQAGNKIDEITNRIISNVTPDKVLSDENLGKTIQEGLSEYETNFKITQSKVYDSFGSKYGATPATTSSTVNTLGEIVTEQGQDYFKGVNPRLNSMLDRLTGETSQVKKLRQTLQSQRYPQEVISAMVNQEIKIPELTFDELKATRTSVGEALIRNPEDTALKRLYGALSDDMNRTVSKVDATAGKQLEDMSQKYASGKVKIESNIAQSIEKSNPERIAQNLIKRNSADTLRIVKEQIGAARFKTISDTFMRQLFEKSMTRGVFDVDKMVATLSSYDKETIDELLSQEQIRALDNATGQLQKLKRLQASLKTGQRISQGSQTAFLQSIQSKSGRGIAFITALISGNFAVAASVLGETGTEYAGVKFISSDIGRKFLTKGLTK